MLSDKELKKEFKKKCQDDPQKHYPVETLHALGFERHCCECCKTYFWTTRPDQHVCGEPACSGGFRFIGQTPAKNRLGYVEAWKAFSRTFKKMGYTPVKRYPVVARWNPTVDFTIASIASFQPYVVTGEVEPPANPLVIPQFCLRFGDIDNVGITGAHYTGFIMLGQHAFVQPKEYDPNEYLKHIHTWLRKGIGLDDEEITFHEDAWAGGGNFGPSVEFFSRGLELGNQVYMQYEQTAAGTRELGIKVLDMGAGLERIPWFTQGTSTSYETTFPTVIKSMRERTGLEINAGLWQRFLPYAAYLNMDETKNIDAVWKDVAKRLSLDSDTLKENILPQAALYSIAEHARALLFSIADGGLPSNVGGMYNLRVILRRALSLIEKHGWQLSLPEIAEWHAVYLKPIFPELTEHLETVQRVLKVEKGKFMRTRKSTRILLDNLADKDITAKQMVDLYDSQGVSPDMLRDAAQRAGRELIMPENFYALVAERHEGKEQEHATTRQAQVPLPELPPTKALYFDDYKKTVFTAKAIHVADDFVVLDQTAFYPTSGGQMHDTGRLGRTDVVDVFKQGAVIVHKLKRPPQFKEGDDVEAHIDEERRIQLAQHHTATHIINAAARKVLGRHINQAGAKKDMGKAHIDLTHYQSITESELRQIEIEANRIVRANIKTDLRFLPRGEAEKRFGMDIYQGGAVPGKELRIVDIPGIDVEACGGTHLASTLEAGHIRILKATKIKDGIVRVTFTAGKAAVAEKEREHKTEEAVAQALGVPIPQVPARAEELFRVWKKARKGRAKCRRELELTSREKHEGDVLLRLGEILKTQPEHFLKTIERFKKDIDAAKEKLA